MSTAAGSPHLGLVIDYASIDEDARPNLAQAETTGLSGVIIRGDYSTWQDPDAARDRDAIRAAGLTYGAYMAPDYSASAPSAAEQVSAFVLGAGLVKGRDLPPWLDIEYSRGIAATGRTRAQQVTFLLELIDALERAFGIDPGKYCSQRVLDTDDTDTLAGAANAVLAGLPNWLARYVTVSGVPAQVSQAVLDGTAPPPIPNCDGGASDPDNWWFRQRQGDAIKFPGLSSTVDVDVFNPLMIGARGRRVKWVQARIGATIDSAFGPETLAKLCAFQAANGLPPFGFVDIKTFCALAWCLRSK